MKQTLIIFTFTLITNSLFACLSASQNRIFPLGQSSKGLCVVETHLYRTEFREKDKKIISFDPAWGGISYFKIYDKQNKEVYSEIIDTIKLFREHLYDSIINSSFKKGLSIAEKYSDFTLLKPTELTFCDYREKCSKAELLFNTTKNKVRIRLANKVTYDVNVIFDPNSIASNVFNYFNRFDDAVPSAKLFKKQLYINSVRQYQLGNKKLTIVHIGTGQESILDNGKTYPPGQEYKADFEFTDINKSVFEEPVLHHGHGFDFLIWE